MIGALVVASLVALGRPPRRRLRADVPAAEDLEALATLLVLGLDAGMTTLTAITWALAYAPRVLAAEAAVVVRRARLDGLATGLRSAVGHSADLFHSLASPVETGAEVSSMLEAFRERMAADAAAEAEARMSRLPVKLIFPLALLMLPGLVLMVAAPALVEVITRLT